MTVAAPHTTIGCGCGNTSWRSEQVMKVTAVEGTVENGQIRLPAGVHLPENTKVYVVIPGVEPAPAPYIGSPRLGDPEQVTDFTKEVGEGS